MPTSNDVDPKVVVRPRAETTTEGEEITLYDAICPVPRCGFVSYGWSNAPTANERAVTHLAEHSTREQLRVGINLKTQRREPVELYVFRESRRHPDWVDDGETLADNKEA